MRSRRLWALALAFSLPLGAQAQTGTAGKRLDEVSVSPTGAVRTIAAALRLVRPGGRIVVEPGTYREPLIEINRPVELVGRGFPTLDGEGTHGILIITGPDVTVRGFRLTRIGTSYVDDRAAIRVAGANASHP